MLLSNVTIRQSWINAIAQKAQYVAVPWEINVYMFCPPIMTNNEMQHVQLYSVTRRWKLKKQMHQRKFGYIFLSDLENIIMLQSIIQSTKCNFVKGAGAHPQNAPCRRRSHALRSAPVRRGRLLSTVVDRWSPRHSILSVGLR